MSQEGNNNSTNDAGLAVETVDNNISLILAEQGRRQEQFVNKVTTSIAESMNLFSKNLSENIQRLSDKLDTSRPAGNTENSVPDDRDNPPQESRVGEQHSENADNSAITENDSENETESSLRNLINNQKRRIKEVLKETSVDNYKYFCIWKP
jgi:hypothetical protein